MLPTGCASERQRCRGHGDCSSHGETSPSSEGQRMEAAATVGMLDASAEGEATCDVAVQFDLPPGAYATMALREVMKTQPPPARLRHIRFDP